MTPSEWLVARDPAAMLESLRGNMACSDLRRFSTACCRRIGPHLSATGRRAVETAERFADGLEADEARLAVKALECFYVDCDSSPADRRTGFAAEAALCCVSGDEDDPTIPTCAHNLRHRGRSRRH